MKYKALTIGVDEAGRGPIAGPVAVGTFVFLDEKAKTFFRGVKESKQLSESQREYWFAKILEAKKIHHVDFKVSFGTEGVIDRKGLSYAIERALSRSLAALGLDPDNVRILLDGGLRAPEHYADQRTIIRGDEKKQVIALASICAKVLRDRKMNRLALAFPKYGFDLHKGYGTKRHYSALKEFGLLDCHRRSFLRKIS